MRICLPFEGRFCASFGAEYTKNTLTYASDVLFNSQRNKTEINSRSCLQMLFDKTQRANSEWKTWCFFVFCLNGYNSIANNIH